MCGTKHLFIGVIDNDVVSGYGISVEVTRIGDRSREVEYRKYKEILEVLLLEHLDMIKLMMKQAEKEEVEFIRGLIYKANDILSKIGAEHLVIKSSGFYLSKMGKEDSEIAKELADVTDEIIK